MSASVGWGLALVGLVAGYMAYGWQGLVMALTMVVFWLLLQFSRSIRVMRMAARRPIGLIDNAVMLQSKLHANLGDGRAITDFRPSARTLSTLECHRTIRRPPSVGR